jgi:hypothetical protein
VKTLLLGVVVVFAAGCSTAPRFMSSQTAYEQYSALGAHDRAVAGNFYERGRADAVKSLYWAQRRAQETGNSAAADPGAGLQRKYINVPVPAHVEPDGTIKEATTQVIEVVQFMSAGHHL